MEDMYGNVLIDGVNEYVTSRYIATSEDEKQQIRQVIEDIFRRWTHRSDASASE
ncbi:hypothetical protein U14_01321 [Candidatus Moduliflexus flocculans]|uniref:Uncharacterized protein n=1 Tax=Candidatus Moduliflexus flocculans TaxID=1499966 RepID=A0A0S6VW12_9BACT|nr:hypothetical protein U14_01321 [Candidatus Moduliflexus flocculans]